jgi:UDP-2,4-diacetamido-2,4,6-trideoxy-beta-L-altropyranose hydrolase
MTKVNKKETIFIRADASVEIGTGHIMRCLALAQAWQDDGGKAYFLSAEITPALMQRLKKEGIQLIRLNVSDTYEKDIKQMLFIGHKKKPDWIVLDGYHFNSDYQKAVKNAGIKLLCIDDYGTSDHYYADIVLNQNISADEALYQRREDYTQLLLGTQYVLLRKEFWQWCNLERAIPKVANKILVTMGGSDPNKVTLKIIEAIELLKEPILEIIVLIGPSNPNVSTVKNAILHSPCSMICVENAINMPELMAWADVALTAGGSTCWELAYMGVPAAITILADNQEDISGGLEQKFAAYNLGYFNSLSNEKIVKAVKDLVYNRRERLTMSTNAKRMVDGYGRKRVIGKMVGME